MRRSLVRIYKVYPRAFRSPLQEVSMIRYKFQPKLFAAASYFLLSLFLEARTFAADNPQVTVDPADQIFRRPGECTDADLKRYEEQNLQMLKDACPPNKIGILYLIIDPRPARDGGPISCPISLRVSKTLPPTGPSTGLQILPVGFDCKTQKLYVKSAEEERNYFKKLCEMRAKCNSESTTTTPVKSK